MTKSSPAIFLHVPKTGGTTLRRLIERNYPSDRVWTQKQQVGPEITRTRIAVLQGHAEPRELARLTKADRDALAEKLRNLDATRFDILQGHFCYGIHEEVGIPPRYFTMLRDPVARVLSFYDWLVQRAGQPLELSSILDSPRLPTRNMQTALIAGLSGRGAEPADLERAKRNLESDFLVVGTTESFDASVLLMARELGWQHARYEKAENPGVLQKERALIESRVRDRIAEMNVLDRELHAFATELLREKMSRGLLRRPISFAIADRLHQAGMPSKSQVTTILSSRIKRIKRALPAPLRSFLRKVRSLLRYIGKAISGRFGRGSA